MTNYLRVPNGDVFIHCGDFLLRSKIQRSYKILDFLEELPHKYKIIVAGNHDVLCDLDFYYATISR